MLMKNDKNETRAKRHRRIRKRVSGTTERPRLNIYRSLSHIYAQLVDDTKGHTVASASSLDKDLRAGKSGGSIEGAVAVGKLVAERAKAAGIDKVVFDRGGYLYHGRVKALADAAREGGLEF
ncbi:MAG: 50S ribosomal protein L18 [Armatimonadota bacterium]